MTNLNSRVFVLVLTLVALAGVPSFAQTSARVDSRWVPYVGCWRLFQENVSDQEVPVAGGMIVCVQPSAAAGGGVAMTTIVEGRSVLEQTILADGTAHPVTENDCQGSETNDWSRDGERLFTRVELQCAGRPKRSVSGVTLMAKGAAGPLWIDVQAIDVNGEQQVRVRRYQRTADTPAVAAAALPADLLARARAESQALSAASMSIEDVIEANGRIGSMALEAALDEAGTRFVLDRRALVRLADAGVSPNAIDLMVAQSFPERFRVERTGNYAPPPPSASIVGGSTTVIMGSAPYPYPYYDPYYYYYSPFAYSNYWGSNYGYNGYNYRYNNYYYGAPSTIIVPAAPSQPPSPPGVVVNGRGYTRVRPNQDNDDRSPAQRTPSRRSGVRSSSGGSESSSSGSSSDSSSSGSSGGSVSGSGYSNGGSKSGNDSGRTAQPR